MIKRNETREEDKVRDRLTLDALADVTAGKVIDHKAVQAWANSLSTAIPLPPPRKAP